MKLSYSILKFALVNLFFFISGCAVEKPLKIPMQLAHHESFKDELRISLIENKKGIGMSYSPKNTTVVPYGPGAAQMIPVALVVGAAITSMENATPRKAAQIGVDRVNDFVTADNLNKELLKKLQENKNITETLKPVAVDIFDPNKAVIPRGLAISTNYAFNVKAEMLLVMASVSLYDSSLNLKYLNVDKSKKNKKIKPKINPIYTNKFYYLSKFHPSPVRTEEDIKKEVDQIKDQFRKKYRKVPTKGYMGYEDLQKKIRIASRDYSVVEKTNLSLDKWLANDAVNVKKEIETAHHFIVSQVYQDYLNYDVPKIDGKDKVIETLEDGRYIRIIGNGLAAGQIESLPKGGISDLQKEDFAVGSVFVFPEVNTSEVNKK